MRVGYLGPEGTFSHEAALAGAASDDELVGLRTNRDVVVAVQDGTVDRAIAPVENLLDGAVTAVLDALTFEAPGVSIIGESILAVRLVLAAAPGTTLADITTVISHPVALGQCEEYLRAHLPDATALPASSTAAAVRSVAGPTAAVGTALAAERYGAVVLAEGIEDDPENRTRFVWLAPTGAISGPAEGVAYKTSLLFHGDGDGSPGWLVRCLAEFAERGVNLTRIESRPLRSELGHYLFHIDCEGHADSTDVSAALAALRPQCEEVRNSRDLRRHPRYHPGCVWGYPHHLTQQGPRRSTSDGVGVMVAVCSSSTRRTNRSMSARFGAPRSSCSSRRPSSSSTARGSCAPSTMPRPMVIRLVSYVAVPRDTHRRKITRRAVFARDNWTCQYCGCRQQLTVDHVVPRSKGGSSDWTNIVASCAPCNRRKGDLSTHQANMHPRNPPRAPSPNVFIHVASPKIPAAWRQWLPDVSTNITPTADAA